MSVSLCQYCEKPYDQDFEVEHEEVCDQRPEPKIKGNIHTQVVKNQLKKEFTNYLDSVDDPKHPQVTDDLIELVFKVMEQE